MGSGREEPVLVEQRGPRGAELKTLSCPSHPAKAVTQRCHKGLCDPCLEKLFGAALASLVGAV